MILLGMIIPLIVAVIVAVAAQVRGRSYWRPCFHAGSVFAFFYAAYIAALAVVLMDALEGAAADEVAIAIARWMLTGAAGGVVAFLIAALVGLPLAADRALERKRNEQNDL